MPMRRFVKFRTAARRSSKNTLIRETLRSVRKRMALEREVQGLLNDLADESTQRIGYHVQQLQRNTGQRVYAYIAEDIPRYLIGALAEATRDSLSHNERLLALDIFHNIETQLETPVLYTFCSSERRLRNVIKHWRTTHPYRINEATIDKIRPV